MCGQEFSPYAHPSCSAQKSLTFSSTVSAVAKDACEDAHPCPVSRPLVCRAQHPGAQTPPTADTLSHCAPVTLTTRHRAAGTAPPTARGRHRQPVRASEPAPPPAPAHPPSPTPTRLCTSASGRPQRRFPTLATASCLRGWTSHDRLTAADPAVVLSGIGRVAGGTRGRNPPPPSLIGPCSACSAAPHQSRVMRPRTPLSSRQCSCAGGMHSGSGGASPPSTPPAQSSTYRPEERQRRCACVHPEVVAPTPVAATRLLL